MSDVFFWAVYIGGIFSNRKNDRKSAIRAAFWPADLGEKLALWAWENRK